MNHVKQIALYPVKTLIATTVASALLAGCATAPVAPEGAARVRANLTQLQSDPNLANRAPLAMQQAVSAVRVAQEPQSDRQLGAYRVYLAERKVETAKAQAETAFLEDQRSVLLARREKARLDARTREADAAQNEVATARANSADEKAAADSAQSEASAARAATVSSDQQNAELQRQIQLLQARQTDRGLVLTLGDVLFTSGQAELSAGASSHLNRLVAFLEKYPDRTVAIQGYTDSVGSQAYNQGLSQRRAESVKSYLIEQGVDSSRISASGMGEDDPVAGNGSSSGRQQNRRVEVIISEPSAALR